MAISGARASFGLSAVGTHTRTKVSGTATIGQSRSEITFADADIAYSIKAVFGKENDSLDFDLANLSTTGTSTWVAGRAQVETATASGTITGSGNASVTITEPAMTGSPKTISVPVTSGDNSTVWAGKVKAALAADPDVSAVFNVSSAEGVTISLSRKPRYTTPSGVPIYYDNSASANIALANGTCTGINNAATSSTVTGIETSGVLIYDEGVDFEGRAIASLAEITGILIEPVNGQNGLGVVLDTPQIQGLILPPKMQIIEWSNDNSSAFEFLAQDFGNEITITVIGKS